MTQQHWDRDVDVVVVGSGGAALVAATLAHDQGASVLVIEKADMLGGTTAVSGGGMFIPGNLVMEAAGIHDTREAALAYIRRTVDGRAPDPSLVEVFVDHAAEALAYLVEHTPLEVHTQPLPDYYWAWGHEGAISRPARVVEADPYPVGDELPEWKDRLAHRGTMLSLGAATTLTEDFMPRTPELEAELRRREEQDIRPKGAALIARLFKGLLERGVETLLGTPGRHLVMDADGAVAGIVAEHDGQELAIRARKGVVLATGGFEWNPEMVRRYIGYDVYPLSPAHNNEGDGLRMAAEVGAMLGNLGSYWGTPAMFDPEIVDEATGELLPQFEWGRGEPSSIIVNRDGRRFANEALPYNDFPKAMGLFNPVDVDYPNEHSWQIFDQKVRDRSRLLSMFPGQPTPEWVPVADTIGELAERIGLDPVALEATVAEYNEHAANREDPLFQRHRVGLMGPGRVAPIDTPPFYALQMRPGTLGTNGGPRFNEHAQVLGQSGEPIVGLYVAGNASANVFGPAYPSGGGTIGAGVTFGYLAGRHVGAQPSR